MRILIPEKGSSCGLLKINQKNTQASLLFTPSITNMEKKMAAKKKAVPAKKVAAKKSDAPVKKVAAKKAPAKKKTSAGAKPGRPKKQVTMTTSNDGFTISVSTPGINPIVMPSNSTSTNATGSVPGIDVAAAVLAAIPEETKKSILKRLLSIFKRSSKR